MDRDGGLTLEVEFVIAGHSLEYILCHQPGRIVV
jgi:hypothetical protein